MEDWDDFGPVELCVGQRWHEAEWWWCGRDGRSAGANKKGKVIFWFYGIVDV